MSISFCSLRRRIVASALALCGAFGVSATSGATRSHSAAVQVDPNVPVPTISFTQIAYNFGKIPAGQSVAHRFTVSNTGQAVLRIEAAIASCSCTSAAIGRQELKPGESTEIRAVYTPEKGFVGAMRRSILIISNDPRHSKLTLRLAGDVLPAAESRP